MIVLVKLVLEKEQAERLRKMCHARGMTPSDLIAAWLPDYDDNGRHIVEGVPEPGFWGGLKSAFGGK